jgi:hypothetical protein
MKYRLEKNQITRLLLVAAACLGVSATDASAAEKLTLSSVSMTTQWTVSYQGNPILVCSSNPQEFKPYVEGFYTVKGYGVLRNSPWDHLHHHALMYGIRVNGVNFWEETPGCGVQKVVETSPPEVVPTGSGLSEARLAQLIYWVAPEDAFSRNTNTASLLIERRTLRLVVDPARSETALFWKSRFEVGSKTNQVVLTGANYHGFGMRFLQELDPVANHITAEGAPDLSNNRQDVTAHPWEAVTFAAPGKPATIAIFGAPSNARGNPVFFAMKTPFAYLSACQGLDKEPLVYKRGDTWELNYLVTLYPEVKSTEALATRAQEWNATGK